MHLYSQYSSMKTKVVLLPHLVDHSHVSRRVHVATVILFFIYKVVAAFA